MFLEYLNVSLLMMRSKPVRSILSLLGIYIGVLALVVWAITAAGRRNGSRAKKPILCLMILQFLGPFL